MRPEVVSNSTPPAHPAKVLAPMLSVLVLWHDLTHRRDTKHPQLAGFDTTNVWCRHDVTANAWWKPLWRVPVEHADLQESTSLSTWTEFEPKRAH